MKIAITGANGFVGSNLCKYFLGAGHKVSALVRIAADIAQLPSEADIKQVDYRDPDSLSSLLSDCDAVIHNAGKTKTLNHAEMLQANLGITENVISAINSFTRPIHLIYISSQAVAGPVKGNDPLSEADPPNPLTSYGKSKLAAEKAIQKSCQKPWTIVRPCSVYGCGDRDFLALFKMVKRGLAVQIGNRDKLLNMIHISELAAFLNLCLTNPSAHNQIFYATDSNTYTQSKVVESIAKALHKNPLRVVIPEPVARLIFMLGEVYGQILNKAVVLNQEKMKEILAPGWLSSVEKAVKLLNWKPEADLYQHIKETAQCYQKLGWL
jgi:nucleoside-diphosphate-sugar epimerase